MEELRIAFLVIGSIFILGVLVHGIWKMRRQNTVPERETETRQEPTNPFFDKTRSHSELNPQSENKGFDEFGIGAVRVIAEGDNSVSGDDSESSPSDNNSEQDENTGDILLDRSADEEGVEKSIAQPNEPEPPMYASVVTQPKPHMNEPNQVKPIPNSEQDIPAPPVFLLKDELELESSEIEKSEPAFGLSPTSTGSISDTELGTKKVVKKRTPMRKRKEPTLGKDQMRIDFDEPILSDASSMGDTAHASTTNPSANECKSSATEVLVINVRTAEDKPLSGAALLPLLLTLGFKFGDQDIFHRHVNANGKGPILFSLANMVKPGVFDIDNLETFTTLGISLFMVLPIEGEPHQVFNMMHNAARKIAEEFDAQLLDGRRSILTKQGIQQYVEKIREFERQRIISNSTR